MDASLIALFALVGAVTGLLAGLFGVGGGIVLVPALTFILATQAVPHAHIVHIALATSLGTIVFTSLSSIVAQQRRGTILWQVVARLTPGILLGSWLGALAATSLGGPLLSAVFAMFLGLTALRMFVEHYTVSDRGLPRFPGLIAAGGGIGALSGLIGGGGGFVSVPFMTWCGVPIHRAVATSAALGFPIAVAGTLSNVYHGMQATDLPAYTVGFVYLPALLPIAATSIVCAPFGVALANRLDARPLRRAFAVLLLCLGGYMLWKAIHSWE